MALLGRQKTKRRSFGRPLFKLELKFRTIDRGLSMIDALPIERGPIAGYVACPAGSRLAAPFNQIAPVQTAIRQSAAGRARHGNN